MEEEVEWIIETTPLVTAGQKKFHPIFGWFFLISLRLNHHLKLHSKFMPEISFPPKIFSVTHRKELWEKIFK
jgi:hypothetical protein